MIQTDMKMFKTSMKLIDELPYNGDIILRVNKDEISWSANTPTWRLAVPIEGSSSIQNTHIKLSHESFMEIFKSLRAVKKDLKVKIEKEPQLLTFITGDEVICQVAPTGVSLKEQSIVTNTKISSFKIDTMLSFLSSVYSNKSNVFTPMDKRVEIAYKKEAISFTHTSSIKMSIIDFENESKKEDMGAVIPVSDLSIAYSLFKNSMEFDGEIHDNDGVIIFSTNRFKIGIKKHHEFIPSYSHLHQGYTIKEFKLSDKIMNQLYTIKRDLNPLFKYVMDGASFPLIEIKTKTSKEDVAVEFEGDSSDIKVNPYHNKSIKEIGAITKGTRGLYDFTHVIDAMHALSDTNASVEIKDNHRMLLSTECKRVKILVLPMIPTEIDDIQEESIDL